MLEAFILTPISSAFYRCILINLTSTERGKQCNSVSVHKRIRTFKAAYYHYLNTMYLLWVFPNELREFHAIHDEFSFCVCRTGFETYANSVSEILMGHFIPQNSVKIALRLL